MIIQSRAIIHTVYVMQQEDRYKWNLDKERREREREREPTRHKYKNCIIQIAATITSSYNVVTKVVIY